MRRSKRSRPRPARRQAKSKTSEIQRRRLLKDASLNKDHPKSTGSSEVYRNTTAINNRIQSKSSTEQRTSKGGMTVSKCVLPTSQKPTGMQSTETHQKSTVKSTKSIMILLKRPLESATMKSTRWSPKRTSKDDYLVKQHLEVNATYRWIPAARDILQSTRKHCMNAQDSAGTLELGKYNHFRETYVLDIDE